MEDQHFCDYFKELRIKKGKTLRQFCLENDLDPGNVSKLERGNAPPPSTESVLNKYAVALGLKEENEEWTHFFDLALSQKGIIPFDLMKDENIVKKLPALFRTIRGKNLDENKIKELIEELKGI